MTERNRDLCSGDSTETADAGAAGLAFPVSCRKLSVDSGSVCVNSLLKTFGAPMLFLVSLCCGGKGPAVTTRRYLPPREVARCVC